MNGTPRIVIVPALFAVAVFLGVVIGGCGFPTAPNGGASATGANPAAGRMGALAGIPAESAIPSGGVVPNPAPFLEAGRLAGANTEVGSLRAAAPNYLADHPTATRLTSDDLVPTYVSAFPKSRYYLSLPSGFITRVDSLPGEWADIVFSLSQQKWGRGAPDNDHSDDQDVP